MRQAREMRGRFANVRRRDLETLARGPVRKDLFGKPSEVKPKIGGRSEEPIKTLATARSGEMGKVKEELKAMLPILKPSEVKRFRLPPHEAIIHELEESNYEESVRYLKELFELDEEIRKEAGPGTLMWKKPRLKDNRDAMLRLREGLIAVERAKNAAGHYEYMANVLYELGMSQLRSGDLKLAFQNLAKFLAIAKRIRDPEGICNAHVAMALAYKELDDDVNTEKYLRLLMISAAESGLTRKLAQAHYCTGEHFLSKGKPDIATSYLEKSFELYNELGLCNDADKSRALAGVSKGQEIIDQYVHLVHQCEAADPRAITALCQWKNRRSVFWTEKEEKRLHAGRRQYSATNQHKNKMNSTKKSASYNF